MSQLKVINEIDVSAMVNRLRSDGMEAIAEVYKLYRNEFLGFCQKYFPHVPRDIILQAWHDTMVAFYEICLANKYDPGRSSLKTFLFSIGKNQLIKKRPFQSI
jgi:DNA-directed RNA polymerase specialized sigma24 family protein